MPIKIRYDSEQGILHGVVTNPLLFEEATTAMAQLTTSDEYPPSIRTLWDLRELDFEKIDRELIERVVDMRKAFAKRGPAKTALVVDHDLGFGMTRMYEILSDEMSPNVMVFRDYEEGKVWVLSE
jgi:hypothetical protein